MYIIRIDELLCAAATANTAEEWLIRHTVQGKDACLSITPVPARQSRHLQDIYKLYLYQSVHKFLERNFVLLPKKVLQMSPAMQQTRINLLMQRLPGLLE